MTHALFLILLGLMAAVVVWFEWRSLAGARMKTVFLFMVIFSYALAIAITIKPGMPGPLQLWERAFDPLVSPWLPP